MIINNPFQINDWKFSDFIKVVLLLQLLLIIVVGLRSFSLNLPIIGELIAFIYLTFIPGFLILRILKMHELGNIKSILYAVGLSITSIMFIGFIMNMVLPVFGISKPLSILPLIIVMGVFVLILSILSYIIDKDFSNTSFIDTKDLFSPLFLFLCLIPFLAIFGAYSMNLYNNNLISMLLIVLIAFVAFLVGFGKIPRKLYPFAIWIIAISLVYDSSLISIYIWGWDIQNEYYLANAVFNTSYWNFMFPDAYNAMLSVVMLSPVYSVIMNMDLIWVFKVVYPFLFSLVPLGLYEIFKKQTNPKIAFLACFLFVSFYTFFIELLSLAREMIAEVLLISILLVIFNEKISNSSKILFVFLGMGLVVSHYSLNYFFLLLSIGAIIILILFRHFNYLKTKNKKFWSLNYQKLKNQPNLFIVAFLVIFTYLWYGNIAQGHALDAIFDAFNKVKGEFFQKLLPIVKLELTHGILVYLILIVLLSILAIAIYILMSRKNKLKSIISEKIFLNIINFTANFIQILGKKKLYRLFAAFSIIILLFLAFLIGKPQTWIVGVLRYLNFTLVFFALTGLILLLFKFSKNQLHKEYYAFSIVSAMVLLAGIISPSFQQSFNITRIFEISFIFLSPFCIIGGIIIFKSLIKAFTSKIDNRMPIRIFSIFLILFMLFNTGFFSVLADQSIPMHLSSESDYYPRFDVQETTAAKWLYDEKLSSTIYADSYGVFVFYKYINPVYINTISKYNQNITSYIFLRKLNKGNILLVGFDKSAGLRIYKNMSEIINTKSRIYDDGDAKIYYG